jgi:hypothetical protein
METLQGTVEIVLRSPSRSATVQAGFVPAPLYTGSSPEVRLFHSFRAQFLGQRLIALAAHQGVGVLLAELHPRLVEGVDVP